MHTKYSVCVWGEGGGVEGGTSLFNGGFVKLELWSPYPYINSFFKVKKKLKSVKNNRINITLPLYAKILERLEQYRLSELV